MDAEMNVRETVQEHSSDPTGLYLLRVVMIDSEKVISTSPSSDSETNFLVSLLYHCCLFIFIITFMPFL